MSGTATRGKDNVAVSPILRNRDFDLYWSGVVLSQIGTRGTLAANLYQVYALSGSLAQTGLVGAAQAIALVVLSPLGLRPDHTTRMAPAIRHLTRRLASHAAASRIMLIISDGRPFDLDYGQQYGEDAVVSYALADTGRALDEARRRGVWPYLITADPAGSDYLADICEPVEYHVIADPRDLPSAVGELYRIARHRAGQAHKTRAR